MVIEVSPKGGTLGLWGPVGRVRKVDSWAEDSARRPRPLEWLWDILVTEDVMLQMVHGSTWMYMDVHGNFLNSGPHVCVLGDVDARPQNMTCTLREQICCET